MPKEIEGSEEYREARFRSSRLDKAEFENVGLAGARFHNTDMSNITISDTTMRGATIEADIAGVTINGFRIDELIEAELERRHPERKLLKPMDPEGYEKAIELIAEMRDKTIAAAEALGNLTARRPDDGQWSVLENLRHLVFAEDMWVRRNAFGEDHSAYHPLGQPPSFAEEPLKNRGVEFRSDAELKEVITVLNERFEDVRKRFQSLTQEVLDSPANSRFEGTVAQALRVYLEHEWQHHHEIEKLVEA